MGIRSYRVRGYKQGRSWEAVPISLFLKVAYESDSLGIISLFSANDANFY